MNAIVFTPGINWQILRDTNFEGAGFNFANLEIDHQAGYWRMVATSFVAVNQ